MDVRRHQTTEGRYAVAPLGPRRTRMSFPAATLVALLAALVLGSLNAAGAAAATNPIVAENAHAGTTAWRLQQNGRRVADDATGQIKGYASATSVNKGESLTFKVSVNPVQQYTIDI